MMYQTTQGAVSYLPLIQTLIGGLLTFIGGLLGSFLIQRSQRNAEKESLASAFYGEVSAVLNLLQNRQLLPLLKELLERIKERENFTFKYFEGRDDKFEVYENNVGKIGLLPVPLPEKLILFYSLTLAAYDDLKALNKLGTEGFDMPTVERYVRELIDLLNDVLESGKEIQSLIKPASQPKAN